LEYTSTDTLHGQLNATAMCYQTIASSVSSAHRPKFESSPNYPCQIRPLRCRKDQPVTSGAQPSVWLIVAFLFRIRRVAF
jgi:hypothetical protein